MANGVIVLESVMAKEIDSLNINAVSRDNINNGYLFSATALSGTAGQGNVFTAVKPATATLGNLYMAYSPENVVTTSGSNQFLGLDQDPRNFTNVAGKVFNGFKLQLGDIILASADVFSNAISTNTFAIATDNAYTLTFAASLTASTLNFKVLGTTYISIGTGNISTQRVTAYRLQVVQLG